MAQRFFFYPSRIPFLVDVKSAVRDYACPIDWNSVTDAYRATAQNVVTSGAAAVGVTVLPVTATPVYLPVGTSLDFGDYTEQTVTASETADAAATTIDVAALTAPIPSGAILSFGGKFAQLTADAATGATSLTVAALAAQIASAATATYSGTSNFATLSVAAAAGATSLTVVPLVNAIASGASAVYGGDGQKCISSGTVMAQLASGLYVPRAIAPSGQQAMGILEDPAVQPDPRISRLSFGYTSPNQIIGGVVYQNLLPDAIANTGDPGTLPSGWTTELASNGAFWVYRTYVDSAIDSAYESLNLL